jgi:hypothetical protein
MTDCVINWTMVLQYLRVFLSWPAVTLYLVLFFLFRFREAVAEFIKRLRSGKVGPVQWSAAPVAQENVGVEPNIPYDTLTQWFVNEKILNNIYGSQLELLWQLQGRADEMGFLEVLSFYEQHRQRVPNSPTEMLAWTNWLIVNNLARTNGDQTQYRISEHGRQFLAYLVQYYGAGIPPRIG